MNVRSDRQDAPLSGAGARGRRAALLLLGLAASAQFLWNAFDVTPLSGYDAGPHAAYVLHIVERGGLPHPLSGWSTFHPPLYYLAGSLVWRATESFGPVAIVAGLRLIGVVALLAMGFVAHGLVARLGGGAGTAWVAAACVLFLPCAQMSAVMVGNEALAAGLGALALPFLLRLQLRPESLAAAAGAGAFVGLALATKYTAAFVAIACLVPFIGRPLGRPLLRALALLLLCISAIAGPVYVRNVAVTGTPFPLTRNLEPMKSAEAANVLRERRWTDYAWLDPRCLLRPSIAHVPGVPRSSTRRNPAMTNVWGLLYASIWYDASIVRVPLSWHRDGVWWGPLLAFLGLVPTLIVLLGFALCLHDALRSRLRSLEAPLVAVWAAGLLAFVAFTWRAPSLAAVKGSYLLPLVVPGAVFFGRGAARLPHALRRVALAVSTAAALLSALVFTHRLVFPAQPPERMAARWRMVDGMLPGAYIAEAVDRLVPSAPDTRSP